MVALPVTIRADGVASHTVGIALAYLDTTAIPGEQVSLIGVVAAVAVRANQIIRAACAEDQHAGGVAIVSSGATGRIRAEEITLDDSYCCC